MRTEILCASSPSLCSWELVNPSLFLAYIFPLGRRSTHTHTLANLANLRASAQLQEINYREVLQDIAEPRWCFPPRNGKAVALPFPSWKGRGPVQPDSYLFLGILFSPCANYACKFTLLYLTLKSKHFAGAWPFLVKIV